MREAVGVGHKCLTLHVLERSGARLACGGGAWSGTGNGCWLFDNTEDPTTQPTAATAARPPIRTQVPDPTQVSGSYGPTPPWVATTFSTLTQDPIATP